MQTDACRPICKLKQQGYGHRKMRPVGRYGLQPLKLVQATEPFEAVASGKKLG